MAGREWPKDVDGFIPKDGICEFEEYCNKSGSRCQRDSSIKYHCGYCKSYRIINILREKTGEKKIGE